MSSKGSAPTKKWSLSSVLSTIVLLGTLVAVIFVPKFFHQEPANLKNLILFVCVLLLALFFAIITIRRGKIKITFSPLITPLIIFGFLVGISILINNPTRFETALLGSGGLYLSLAAIGVLGSTLVKVKNAKFIINTVAIIASVLSIISLASSALIIFSGEIPSFIGTHQYVAPTTYLAFIAIALAGILAIYIKKGKVVKTHLFLLPILILGFISTILLISQTHFLEKTTPSWSDSWHVATNSLSITHQELENNDQSVIKNNVLDNIRTFLIGSGSESYVDVFNRYKPVSINQTSNWNTNFYTAVNLPLTMFSTLGILATIMWFYLIWRSWSAFIKESGEHNFTLFMLAVSLVLQLFIPLDPIILTLQAVLLAFSANLSKETLINLSFSTTRILKSGEITEDKKEKTNTLFYVVSLLMLFVVAWAGFRLTRGYLAYYYHEQSLRGLAHIESSDLLAYYQSASKAVKISPDVDVFNQHAAVANLEMAIYSDSYSQYLSQAVDYAKHAVSLNEKHTANWTVQGKIYQDIAHLSEESTNAYDWASRSFAGAILTQPTNPELYLLLGNVYEEQQNYTQAISFYDQALTLKTNYVAAYFSLGNAYKLQGDNAQALAAYYQALENLDKNDLNYLSNTQAIQGEIDILQGLL